MRFAVLAGLLVGCTAKPTIKRDSKSAQGAAASQARDEPIGYSSGDWWQDESLNGLLLNASQIVISYADAQSGGAPVPLVSPADFEAD